MEYAKDLESGSSPKIRKATKKIIDNNLTGYCSFLLDALTRELKKPKAWQTQCILIKAIGITNCSSALPFLKEIIDIEFDSTVLYRDLAFSIFLLENTEGLDLSFLFHSIKKNNELQISGVCAAILYKKLILMQDDMHKVLTAISPYTKDEGRVLTPRYYIAAVTYLWPKTTELQKFLESCLLSNSEGLVEIAQYSAEGKEPKIRLI